MGLDETWVLSCAFFSILGVLGYAFIAGGAVRYKSVQSAIITVLLGAILTIIAFFITGYAFSFGVDSNQFIGKSLFAGAGFQATQTQNDYDNFIFHTIGAMFVTSLFALGTLERARFFSFSFGVIILQGLLYPIVVHWTFGNGWLKKFGFVDFGGSTIIHVFGGVTALVSSLLLTERRDQNGRIHPGIFPHHAPLFVGLGALFVVVVQTIFLSGLNKNDATNFVKGLVPVNTLIAAAFGGLTSYVAYYLKKEKTSLISLSRGAVAGVVAVSASVDDIQLWAAALIGSLAGVAYLAVVLLVKRSHVDDPAQAIAAHLVPGVLGTLLLGILSRSHGLFYAYGLKQFGIQIVGVLAIAGWAVLILGILVPLKGFGIFKIKPEQEAVGIDSSYAGGEAYVFSEQVVEAQSLLSSQKKSIFH